MPDDGSVPMTPMATESLPTFAFKDGELQITEDRTRWFLAGWPNLRAELAEKEGERRETRPEFRLFKPREADAPLLRGALQREMHAAERQLAKDAERVAQKHAAFEAYRATFPEPVIAAVERFQSHQWNLIDLIHRREREALDLARSNLALFYCLANNDVFREHKHLLRPPAYLAMWLLPEKQRSIAEWLGFPATEAMITCLRKIPPEAITTMNGRLLRQSVKADPNVLKALGHVPVLNRSVLHMVYMWRLFEIVTPGLLLEVSQMEEDKFYPHVAERLMDAVRLFAEMRNDQRPPQMRSIRKIDAFHAEMVREYARHCQAQRDRAHREQLRRREVLLEQARQRRIRQLEAERDRLARRMENARRAAPRLPAPPRGEPRDVPPGWLTQQVDIMMRKARGFPPPPVPGTDDIIPITTVEELAEEARMMQNCAAGYADLVRTGKCYIYRLLKPERAMFSLVRSGSNWQLAEIKTKGNRDVKANSIAAVRYWLDGRTVAI